MTHPLSHAPLRAQVAAAVCCFSSFSYDYMFVFVSKEILFFYVYFYFIFANRKLQTCHVQDLNTKCTIG